MKNLQIIPALLLLTFALSAQSSAKKYVLLEHFTNSNCGICAFKNPAFYSLIGQAQYADDVHHIAIHPPYPYDICVFYMANKPENSAWAALYNIFGTPRVAVNGRLMPSQSQLLRQDTLNKYIDQTSPLYLKVSETGAGNNRSAKIEARALSQIPAGNYKFYAAIVEKTINMATTNGEAVHHDVFREMLTPVDGQNFTPPAAGQSMEFNFDYTISNSWHADEIYVLAFVKEVDSQQVLNSGTKFDPVLTLSTPKLATQRIRLSPNPATATTIAELGTDKALRTEVFASSGKLVYSATENQKNTVAISTANFVPGIYFVKITAENGTYTAKFVKE